MKKFEDLNKKEREKLLSYQLYCLNTKVAYSLFMVLSMMLFVPGVIMILTKYPFLVLMGILFVMCSIILYIPLALDINKTNKNLMLVYGMNDSMKGLFEITDKDREKVVRINELVIKEEK